MNNFPEVFNNMIAFFLLFPLVVFWLCLLAYWGWRFSLHYAGLWCWEGGKGGLAERVLVIVDINLTATTSYSMLSRQLTIELCYANISASVTDEIVSGF